MSRKHSDLKGANVKSSWEDEPTNRTNSSNMNPIPTMNTGSKTFATDDDWDTPVPSANSVESDTNANASASESVPNAPIASNNAIATSTRFDNMGIKENLLRGVFAAGFEQPAPCQQTIPAALPDPTTGIVRDVILAARAGSGKTLYFGIVALNCVEPEIKKLQVIIVSPTRELASQTFKVACEIGAFSGVSIALHRGVGNKTKKENTAFTRGDGINVKSESYITFGNAREGEEQIIVATPGRLLDIMTNEKGVRISPTRVMKKIDTSFTRLVVMDEADELLSPKNDFQETIAQIFSNIPTIEFCQKIIVSATITDPVLEICRQILQNPIQILVKKEEVNITTIKQYYVGLTQEEDKAACLLDIYANASIGTSIVFANTSVKAEYIYNLMKEQGFSVGYIHAKLPMQERDKIMQDFRTGNIRVLIATDLIARGIDVQSVSVVFNYDLPPSMENYIHRVGRCGRYGRTGVAVNFVIEPNNSKPKDIVILEKYYNLDIRPLPSLDILKI
jgi:superfamily II DNA/RNA helicase